MQTAVATHPHALAAGVLVVRTSIVRQWSTPDFVERLDGSTGWLESLLTDIPRACGDPSVVSQARDCAAAWAMALMQAPVA
eukprot:m.94579 g.94579  ORF g.94579 m.94579 type:complete len:81 (+) comp20375_c3_seq1:1248-1490(+)